MYKTNKKSPQGGHKADWLGTTRSDEWHGVEGGDFCLTYSTHSALEAVNWNTSEDSQNKPNKSQVSVAKGSGKKQPGKIENVYRQ